MDEALPSPDSDLVEDEIAEDPAVRPEAVGCLPPLCGFFPLYRQEVLDGAQHTMSEPRGFIGISGKMVFNDRREVIKNLTRDSIRGKRLIALP